MKKIARHSGSITLLSIALVCMLLFSFENRYPGGEGYEVFLNKDLLLRHFGPMPKHAKMLDLQQAKPTDRISVRYYHCGRIPENSLLTFRTEKREILKKCIFSFSKESVTDANCHAGEIFKVANGIDQLQLYFSSAEVPDGRLLATIKIPVVKQAF